MASLSNLDKDIMVVTSTYVMNEGMPILYMSHDDDEEGGSIWQFHCDNGDYDMEKMLLVKLGSILKLDTKLFKIELEIGQEARRTSDLSDWIISEQA